MFGGFARILWEAVDWAACALTVGQLCLLDLIHGPEPSTPADKKRELDRERLRKAFPKIDFGGTTAPTDEKRRAQMQAAVSTPVTAASADRSVP
jgi:hypothetical protein